MSYVRFALMLGVLLAATRLEPLQAASYYCENLCNPEIDCETQCIYGGSVYTCGAYSGGNCDDGDPCYPDWHDSPIADIGQQESCWTHGGHTDCKITWLQTVLTEDYNQCASSHAWCNYFDSETFHDTYPGGQATLIYGPDWGSLTCPL